MFNKTKSRFTANKYVKFLFLGGLAFLVLNLHGCLLDAFDTLTQEIPFTYDVDINGTGTEAETSTTINLNDNNFYNEHRDKINKIELLKIAYKTKSVNPTNVSGTIQLTVRQSNGVILFSKVIPGNRPADYMTNPFEISLSQAEIQLVNAYLSILSNRTFTATVHISNATAGTKSIQAQVFTTFKMDYDL